MINTTKTEWKFEELVTGNLDNVFEKEKELVVEKAKDFAKKWERQTDYLKDEKILKEALDDYEELNKNYGTSGKIGYYLWLKKMQNQSDEDIKAKYNLIDENARKVDNIIQFFSIKIAKIPKEIQKKFLSSPLLSKYKHYLERRFRIGKHILSEAEEKILTLKDAVSYENWVSMTSEILAKEEREVFTGKNYEKKNFSEIMSMTFDQNKKIRDSAAEAFNEILSKNADVATAEINSILQNKKIDDELRGYARPDESRIVADDIDNDFVDDLISSVSKRFNIAKKIYELKARLLGVPQLKYHERNLRYGTANKEISYEESANLVYNTFRYLDKDFEKIVEKMFNGYVDAFPKKGKRNNAFCANGLKTHPTYILLNFTNKFDDVRIMSHELGHAINNELIKKQNALNSNVPMATAEVASNFFEEIVFQENLKKIKNEEEKLSIMVNRLQDDVGAIFRQIACYNFEKKLHEEFRKKGNLGKDEIGKIFRKNMEAYMGEFIEQSDGAEIYWVSWPHIREFFYVYSYSSGCLIAKAMIKIIKENPDNIIKIKEFLSSGKSKSPRELFEEIGVKLDERFWDIALEEMEKELNETWELAEKLGKI